jgi:NADH dehydrogenase
MRVAITGGTGFVGRHLARQFVAAGHEVVLVARGADRRDPTIRDAPGIRFERVGLTDATLLAEAFHDCDAIAHCAGINRELGTQTFEQVHVAGTANVVQAALQAGVGRIVIISFLRARPECGSPYHESKWQAEEIVRRSGLEYTVVKAGMIYGRGDHMLDHLSHAFHTLPLFALVGRDHPVAPLAVEDVVRVLAAALVDPRLSNQTVALVGPELMTTSAAIKRVAAVVGRRPLMFRLPVWAHMLLARLFERLMVVPLVARAQVRILSESVIEPLPFADSLPENLAPRLTFSREQIQIGLPQPGAFGLSDLRIGAQLAGWVHATKGLSPRRTER